MTTMKTHLENGEVLETTIGLFSYSITTKKYVPLYDIEDDFFYAPFSKDIIIDKVQGSSKNIYLLSIEAKKRHNEILTSLTK